MTSQPTGMSVQNRLPRHGGIMRLNRGGKLELKAGIMDQVPGPQGYKKTMLSRRACGIKPLTPSGGENRKQTGREGNLIL